METFYCIQCKREVDLDGDEEMVFTENNLRDGDTLQVCPFCITGSLTAALPAEHMRMTGHAGRWGRCGYHSTDDERIITVERRFRD